MAATSAKKPADLDLPSELDGVVFRHIFSQNKREFHRHRELEFNLIVAGSASYLVGERRYDLTAGTLIWLFPAEAHLLINESADFVMWIGVFKPAMIEPLCREPEYAELGRQRPLSAISKRLIDDQFRQLDQLLGRISTLADQPTRHNAGLAWLLVEAWQMHRDARAAPPGSDVHPAVERAARLIRNQPTPINLDQIAERAGLSPSHLSRLFKRQTGLGLSQYRQRQQLRRFGELYGHGRRRNLTQAALAAGFGSYAQFHRVFSQTFGFNPAEYRRRLRE